MNRKTKVVITMCLCFIFFFSNVVMAQAGYADTQKHWASGEISKWSEAGLLKGKGDGTFKPDAPISRAEFISLISRLFNLVNEDGKSFSDVSQNAWYAADISKASAAGIINGDAKGNANPLAYISRQEAATVMYRAFDLKVNDINAADKFLDAAQIASWSMPAVCAMVESAYVKGKPGNIFSPNDNLTRAEAVKILDNMVADIKNAAGEYTGDVEGNLVINTPGIVLNNMTVNGNLYIAQGVGEGEVTLNNVVVKGKTIVKGGGENSIILNNTSLVGTLLIIKKDGKVRVVAKGSTEVRSINLSSGAKLQETDLSGEGFGDLEIIEIAPGEEIKLDGDFKNVHIDAPNTIVEVLSGSVSKLEVSKNTYDAKVNITSGTIGEINLNAGTELTIASGVVNVLNINEGVSNSSIIIDEKASITSLNAASGIKVTGASRIETANINADGVIFDSAPKKISNPEGKPVVVDGKVITGSGSTTVGGGGGGDNGSGSGEDEDEEDIPLNLVSSTVYLSVGESVYAGITTNLQGVEIIYSSSNSSVAAVNSSTGLITAAANGTANITATASKNGYNATSVVIGVTVGPRSEAGELYVYPAQATKNTRKSISLFYAPNEYSINSSVTFSLPREFAAADGDYIYQSSGPNIVISENHGSNMDHSVFVTDNGKKVTVTKANTPIELILAYKTVPSSGVFNFSAFYDQDGSSNSKIPSAGTGSEEATLEVVNNVANLDVMQVYKNDTPLCSLNWSKPANAESVVLQKRLAGEDEWVSVTDSVYDAGEFNRTYKGEVVDIISWVILDGLTPNVDYEFRLEVTGGENEGYSNITEFMLDTVPPELESGYPVLDAGDHSVEFTFKYNEDATTYCLILLESQYSQLSVSEVVYTPITAENIIDWYDFEEEHNLTIGSWRNISYSNANEEGSLYIRSLDENTDYIAFITAKDSLGNTSVVEQVYFTTEVDVYPPEFVGEPEIKNITEDSFDVWVKSNESAYCYYVLFEKDMLAPPDEVQIINGTDGDGNTEFMISDDFYASTYGSYYSFNDYTPGAEYDMYMVLKDYKGHISSIKKITITL